MIADKKNHGRQTVNNKAEIIRRSNKLPLTMCPSIYLFIFCLQKMWCWTEDGLEQPSGMKTATKHKKQKIELRKKQEKKQHFLGINKKLFIFLQVFFSKTKKELRHSQKWDKLSLQVTIFKQACCFIELKWKEKTVWNGIQYQENWETVNFQEKKNNSLKLWTEKWMEIPFKPLITLCVFLRKHHHLC